MGNFCVRAVYFAQEYIKNILNSKLLFMLVLLQLNQLWHRECPNDAARVHRNLPKVRRISNILQTISLLTLLFPKVSTSNRPQPNVPGLFADKAVKTSNSRDWQLHLFTAAALEVSNHPDLPSNHRLWPDSNRQIDTPPVRCCTVHPSATAHLPTQTSGGWKSTKKRNKSKSVNKTIPLQDKQGWIKGCMDIISSN